MSKVILITGGSRSGKSRYAEELLSNTDDVLYIATSLALDDEMKDRIKKHRLRRNQKWETYEGYKNLDNIVENCSQKNILLDCVTIMITNLMFDKYDDFDNIKLEQIDELSKYIQDEFCKLIKKAKEKSRTLIMVTNEVGSGLVPEYKLGRIYRDISGFTNQYIGGLSDEVYFVTCGLPMKLK